MIDGVGPAQAPKNGRPKSRTIAYGVFKGMGDLVAAAPVIASLLRAGDKVVLLVFPQIAHFVDLIDLGSEVDSLTVLKIASGLNLAAARSFMRGARQVSPDLIWLSPHTPSAARSWKIPLAVWLTKKLYWRSAKLGGAVSERLSWLFDRRVPIDRRLPFSLRERAGFAAFYGRPDQALPAISFKQSVVAGRPNDTQYDLLVFPGAIAANRRWPMGKYGELLRSLPPGWKVGICAMSEDAAILRGEIQGRSNLELLEVPLIEAIRRMKNSRAIFSMDSGPMFFAQAVGVPVVALFGASDPDNVIATEDGIVPVYRKKWSCQPCGNSRCIQPEPYCITSIAPADVAAEIYRVVEHTD